jgi:hypothetical protein
MCLDYELSEKQAAKIIQQARKRGYIRVWKRCHHCHWIHKKQTGYFQEKLYRKGVRKASFLRDTDGGWYVFLNKKAATKYYWGNKLIVCYAKLSWIKRLGGHDGVGYVGIFTHLAFPDWDKGDMTIREFKEMCKAEQEQ